MYHKDYHTTVIEINSSTEFAPLDWHNVNHEWRVNNTTKDEGSVSKNLEKTKQNHKTIDTRDAHSSHRYQLKSCARLRLWCVSLCRRKKKYSKRVVGEPTRRFFKHIKKKRKKCRERDEAAVAGVSTALHRESISSPSGPEKSRRSHKQDETVEVTDKEDVDIKKEKKDRKKRRTTEEEEWERKERERKERREKKDRRERRKREKEILHLTDTSTQVSARDEDLVVEDHIPRKPPPTDFTKSCCYLCAENTLAIAAAASKPEQSDKSVQVLAHKFRTETFPMLNKSCSPLLLVRTVQSSVKVRTRETSTLCPDPDASAVPHKETRTKKRKKFSVFPRLMRTKCPAGRNAACETDKLAARRDGNTEKHEPRIEKCCREKNT